MLPWNYGFHWSTGSIIFLGAFYTVLVVVLTTVITAASVRGGRWRRTGLRAFAGIPIFTICRHGTAPAGTC